MLILLLHQILVHGNSATATKLQTPRKITLSGAVKGNANFDGSGNVEISTTQNNIFVLSGSVNIDASSGSNIIKSYPSGLNADNCIPIACGIKYSTKGFNYVGKYDNSMDSFLNAYKRTLTLTPEDIFLRIDNCLTSAGTFYYKIVLMKIN